MQQNVVGLTGLAAAAELRQRACEAELGQGPNRRERTGAAVVGTGTVSFAWDLNNDGTYETAGQTASASFADNGTYTVRLRATDGAGVTAFSSASVTVSNMAPTAAAGGPYTVTAGQPTTLSGSATDPGTADMTAGLRYTWDFGDGTPTVSGMNMTAPAHTYTVAGTYTVTLLVTDSAGQTGTISRTITVNP